MTAEASPLRPTLVRSNEGELRQLTCTIAPPDLQLGTVWSGLFEHGPNATKEHVSCSD